ncbi:glycosyltransferase family 4 protein [Fulvivirgaceae bacterium PWU4]|uniref:Glycosyltransferase family 4 protein n=1 Tax=Chryseosolibacter histidini TaxID=2782349 RepID=A0AAP2DKX0_9BACT|nr:glycosyltransferase family 1 protein [Chryseosolibacter histidini]MBT1697399.1 glycosyltransferase family 4 protein [Chryseosolibacter histidini]
MKIGIEVQRLFRKKKYGIETSSLALLKKLQSLHHDTEFVVFVKDDVDRDCFSESANFKIKKVAGKFFVDFEQFFLPLAARREKVDLLHCTGNTTPYFSPVPVVQTLHDIIFMDPIPNKDSLYQRLGNQYRRKVVPLVSPHSRAIITVSHYEKQRIVSRLGIDEKKIEVVYNGINEDHFYPSTDDKILAQVRHRYGLPENFILFLGNPSRRKNPMGVIEAYVMYASKVANPLPLVTPGLTQKFIAHVLKNLNAEYDPKRFITPGYIRDEDLPFIYGLSKLFLFPSLSEGFGMPVIEAMACGTPVITSKISCMPEIAGDAALLVDPLSAPSIADGLLRMLGNADYRERKIRDGLANAKRFSWDTAAERVLSIYESVLYPSKSARPATSSPLVKKIPEPNFYFFNKPR